MSGGIHPAAAAFPMLGEKRLRELADDIAANGQREAICTLDGMILDGRNRAAACDLIDVVPKFRALPAETNPWAYVWSLNGQRRDLASAQRYGIWRKCTEHSDAWLAEVARIKAEADAKRAAAAKAQPRNEDGTRLAAKPQVLPQPVATPAETEDAHKTASAKAKASGTDRGTVERMDALYRKRPDLYEKVVAGEMTDSAATKAFRCAISNGWTPDPPLQANGDGTYFKGYNVSSFQNKRRLVIRYEWPKSMAPWPIGQPDLPALPIPDLPLFTQVAE